MSRVLVTGAASGLGAALVRAFRSRGDDVLATDLRVVEVRAERALRDGAEPVVEVRAERAVRDGAEPVVEVRAERAVRDGAEPVVEVRAERALRDGAEAVVEVRAERASKPPLSHPEEGASSGTTSKPPSTQPKDSASAPRGSAPRPPELFPLDVTSDDDWEAALAWVRDNWGGLDVLVNNAGVAGGGRVDVCTMDEWRWITEINLFGVVRGTRTFAPMFKEQRSGHVVNVASLAGLVHPAGMGSYNAVKAAVVAFTETVGHELAQHGVRASVACPSYFRSNLVDAMRGADEKVGRIIGGLVASSKLTPDDIAAAVLDGIDRGDDVIVPDEAARFAYNLKWADRPAYDQMMREQAEKLERA